jgi:4-phospho-D-threonate 3-dehydrogenase / 4-phospho-D-erythronate 3-dehydrogenase
MYKPLIGITMGDPASIGPEIALKAVIKDEIKDLCNPILIGDANVFRRTSKSLKLDNNVVAIQEVEKATFSNSSINVFDLKNVDVKLLEMGKVSPMAGNAAFFTVKKAIELAMNKEIDATVTGPIHKESINMAGHKFSGHTEIYAHFTNQKKYAMLLVEENFRVIHVSTHVSLREACDKVKKNRILEVIELLSDACKTFGISRPRIAVAGLNPHASDGGLFGDEEAKEIIPAVEEANKMGIVTEGPFPADSLFAVARTGAYDGCVAMYHDQGHIPFKMVGFQWDKEKKRMKSVSGVNITLGLPIIRTSVDHGTAFEIAGKGVASEDAMVLAIKYAIQIFNKKSNHHKEKL